MHERMVAWGPAAVWAAVLFFLGALPDVSVADLPVGDKVAHLAMYGVLGALLAWGRARGPTEPPHLLLVLLGTIYGLLDEIRQAYVPGRDPSGGDVLADTLGVLLGYIIVLTFLRRAEARTDGG